MVRVYVPVTFLFLGWAFFEASGGLDFEPQAPAPAPAPAPVPETVAVEAAAPEPPAPPPAPEVAAEPAPEPVAEPAPLADTGLTFDSLSSPGNNQIGASPAAEITAPPSSADATGPQDLRLVSGENVNMRTGPGTIYPAVASLARDTLVVVLETATNGWVRVEVAGTLEIGWMSGRLLTERSE